MKKILLLLIGLFGILVVSCSKDDGGSDDCQKIGGFEVENNNYYVRSEGVLYQVDEQSFNYFHDKVVNKKENPCFKAKEYDKK